MPPRPRPYPILLLIMLSACAGMGPGGPMSLQARLQPVDGSGVEGVVTFFDADAGVLLEATVTGLARGGHAFHIHEGGDCAPADAGRGGHFNPDGRRHGRWDVSEKHVGDLLMLVADAGGRAYVNAFIAGPSVRSGARGIAGRTVVVHARPDDYFTQPDGNAGPALACGVIGRR